MLGNLSNATISIKLIYSLGFVGYENILVGCIPKYDKSLSKLYKQHEDTDVMKNAGNVIRIFGFR